MTRIDSITREEMEDLISSGEWGKIGEDQLRTLQDWLQITTNLWAGMVDGELICVYGIAAPNFLSDHAYFWLWTTDRIKEHEFIFVRRSQMVVKELLSQYELLIGHCERGAKESQRWLKWLGAKFGKADGDMIPFEIRRA